MPFGGVTTFGVLRCVCVCLVWFLAGLIASHVALCEKVGYQPFYSLRQPPYNALRERKDEGDACVSPSSGAANMHQLGLAWRSVDCIDAH